jgi:hypothetical protein
MTQCFVLVVLVQGYRRSSGCMDILGPLDVFRRGGPLNRGRVDLRETGVGGADIS